MVSDCKEIKYCTRKKWMKDKRRVNKMSGEERNKHDNYDESESPLHCKKNPRLFVG